MGWKPDHGRIKPKYNPQPNAEEVRHERRLRELPCIGCGRWGVELHHTLVDHPEKRWRRDHRLQLPVCAACHRGVYGIHGLGSEPAWAELHDLSNTGVIAWHLWLETVNG